MQQVATIAAARQAVRHWREAGLQVGLVPTMGAIHAGHLSLVEAARNENDRVAVSIFVNPEQFNNPDDLARYPRTPERDLALLREVGCDMVFMPQEDEMYPQPPFVGFTFGHLEKNLEGAFRPGHFSGVGLVVLKLFHILEPHRAYFGQKDLQQFKIIERLVQDTSLEVELRMMPIVREPSGLALSSRNQRLSEAGRQQAAQIYRALQKAVAAVQGGATAEESLASASRHLRQSGVKTEYLTWVNLEDWQEAGTVNAGNPLALCFAGYVEEVRLIDNIIWDGSYAD